MITKTTKLMNIDYKTENPIIRFISSRKASFSFIHPAPVPLFRSRDPLRFCTFPIQDSAAAAI